VNESSSKSLPWVKESLQQALVHLPPSWQVELIAEIDSTSSELMRRGHQHNYQPTVLVAQHQRSGRGRSGKHWLSDPHQSITLSMACALAPPDWMGLSLACGVGVVNALETLCPQPLGLKPHWALKWPNDIWAYEAGVAYKVGGLLIETQSLLSARSSGHLSQRPAPASLAVERPRIERFCVLGVGLNLRTPSTPPTSGLTLSPPAKGVFELGFGEDNFESKHALLASIVLSLASTLRQFEALGFAPFQQEFERLDCLKGGLVNLSDSRHGKALGVTAQGELMVEIEGQVHHVQALEVSVRPTV
jgi:BirA family transcriptional regulator, biotin operon repressor / biotin---[acetyl-CoA-carboxylase] ligase